jgi:hypothetical protein
MAVVTRSEAQSAADTISDETVSGQNTAARVGGLLRDLADSAAFTADGGGGGSQTLQQVLSEGNNANGTRIENLGYPDAPDNAATLGSVQDLIDLSLAQGGIPAGDVVGEIATWQSLGGGEFGWRKAGRPVILTGNDEAWALSTYLGGVFGNRQWMGWSFDVGTETATFTVGGGEISNLLLFSERTTITNALRLSGAISPTALSATVNDFAPALLSIMTVVRLTTDNSGPYSVTGLAGGEVGKVVLLFNMHATDTINLEHEDSGSEPENQFILPNGAQLGIPPGGGVQLWYDNSDEKWRAVSLG